MTRPLSNDLREHVVRGDRGRRQLPVGGGPVRHCRLIGGEVGAALPFERICGTRQDGWPSQACSGAASGVHGGAAQPDAASVAAWAVAELAARGVKVSHDTVWQFLRREGLRFKKTLFALKQARSDIARRRQRWRSFQAGLDRSGWSSSTRPGSTPTWPPCAAGVPRASACAASLARPLAHADLPRRAALRSARGTLRLRRANQRPMLPRLCRAAAHHRAEPRRHRRQVWTPPLVQEESFRRARSVVGC